MPSVAFRTAFSLLGRLVFLPLDSTCILHALIILTGIIRRQSLIGTKITLLHQRPFADVEQRQNTKNQSTNDVIFAMNYEIL